MTTIILTDTQRRINSNWEENKEKKSVEERDDLREKEKRMKKKEYN